jgi:hypothetical protein
MVPSFNPQWKSVMQVWSLCAVRTPYGELVFLDAFAQNCGKQLLASSAVSGRPSVRMEQRGSHWTDFHEI